MIDCNPSPGRAQSPYSFTNFQSRNMIADVLGTGINAVFPLASRIATLDLNAEAMVYALSLSSSLINSNNLDTVGIFVALDSGETVDVEAMNNLFLSHLTRQNSLPGLPVASSRANALNFGEQTAYKLSSGSRLALYCCSGNFADNEISAICSVYWAPNVAR